MGRPRARIVAKLLAIEQVVSHTVARNHASNKQRPDIIMVRLPIALSISFCESLTFDMEQRRASLQGLFSTLFISRFPSDPIHMSFFSYLCDGQGEGELKVQLHRLFSNRSPQFVWRQRRWISFPSDPLLPIATHFEAKTCLIFPDPADYLVQLMFDGKEIAQRILFVRQE